MADKQITLFDRFNYWLKRGVLMYEGQGAFADDSIALVCEDEWALKAIKGTWKKIPPYVKVFVDKELFTLVTGVLCQKNQKGVRKKKSKGCCTRQKKIKKRTRIGCR